MNIRRSSIDDIPQLATLFDAYRVFYEKSSDVEQAIIFLSERIQKNESVIFVAENEEKQLTGFVQLYPLFSSTRMKRFWLLNDLFVAPEQRSKGISVALIDAVKELTEMLSKDLADCIDKEVVKQLAVVVERDKRKIVKKIKKRNGILRKILL